MKFFSWSQGDERGGSVGLFYCYNTPRVGRNLRHFGTPWLLAEQYRSNKSNKTFHIKLRFPPTTHQASLYCNTYVNLGKGQLQKIFDLILLSFKAYKPPQPLI